MAYIYPVFMLAVALIATTLLIRVLRRYAPTLGLTDHPGERKHHHGAIPLVGGIAMMVVFMTLLPWVQTPQNTTLGLILALAVITAVGAVDDVLDLSPRLRFAAQIIASSLVMGIGGTLLVNLGDLLGTGELILGWWLAIPFTVFCVVGMINALNMMDGMDGLAGGTALIATGWLVLLAGLAGHTGILYLLGLLGAVIGGFLCFNLRHPWRSRASVFMGDAGSMGLGFILAWLLIQLSQGDTPALSPITAVWVLGLPLIDTVSIMIRRKRRGLSPFAADRHHLHHLFHRSGLSDGQTTVVMLSLSALLGAIGAAGEYWHVPGYLMHLGFWVLFLSYHLSMQRIWHELDEQPRQTARAFQTLNEATGVPHETALNASRRQSLAESAPTS